MKKSKLNLILTEIPKIHVDKHFPPLFKFAENEAFDFRSIRYSSPYFWYPPIQNLDKIVQSTSRFGENKKNKYFVEVPPQKLKIPVTLFRKKRKGTLYKKVMDY